MKRSQQHNRAWALPAVLVCVFLFSFFAAPVVHAVVFESGIPGVGEEGAAGKTLPTLTRYVSFLYVFVLGMVGIAGFISLVIWGTVWVATGIVDKKAMALESIKNTFIGIGIALTATIILATINPDLIRLSLPGIKKPSTTTMTPQATCSLIATAGLHSTSEETKCEGVVGCCWETSVEVYGGNPVTFGECKPIPCNN